MDKTKSYKVPVIFYLLSLLESAAGLTGLYFSYPAAAYIVLFLLLLNPLFIQLFSVRPYVKKQMSQPYISVEYQNRLSDFEEKFNTLSQNHKTLSEKNTALRKELSAQKQLLADAPLLYQCPVDSAMPVSIDGTLQTYLKNHQNDIERFDLLATVNYEADHCTTMLSQSALTLIFDNLLDNSLKYTPSGGTLLITLTRQNDCSLLIWKNSGKGIPESDIEKVFDLNYRLNTAGSGTGFGLAQIKALINAYGGSVWAKSSLDNGFTVFIQIPEKCVIRKQLE